MDCFRRDQRIGKEKILAQFIIKFGIYKKINKLILKL